VQLAPETKAELYTPKSWGKLGATEARDVARAHFSAMVKNATIMQTQGRKATKKQLSKYETSFHEVAEAMPPAMLEAAMIHVQRAEFHPDLHSLTQHIMEITGEKYVASRHRGGIGGAYRPDLSNVNRNIGPTSGRERADVISDATAAGLGIITLDGGYNEKDTSGKRGGDGGKVEHVPKGVEHQFKSKESATSEHIYAHELGHAIDWAAAEDDPSKVGRKQMLSSGTEWDDAWKEDILPRRSTTGFGSPDVEARLTKYANSDAAEGFAEYVRAVTFEPQWAEETFPKCWAVLKKRGLV